MTVPERTLGTGSAALRVPAMGLGCMGMTQIYGPSDEHEAIATIQSAIDAGVTLLDTADMYGPYANEELVGRAVKGRRDQTLIATKFGFERGADGTILRINGRPDYVRGACEASLQRLGCDVIDLYYQHRVDPTVPLEDTWGAMRDLANEGKIRFAGISEAAPSSIRRAHAIMPLTAVQTEWSLWSRDVETNGVLDTVRQLGIGFIAYAPLGRGFLTGAIKETDDLAPNDGRRGHPRFQAANLTANRTIIDRIEILGRRAGATSAQIALAWVLARGGDVIPIPGTKKRDHLAANVAALRIDLSPSDLDDLASALPPGVAAGNRYPDDWMANIDT
jgi:aryl-alcohol dehydrogenase-like predicted oxidoreductase